MQLALIVEPMNEIKNAMGSASATIIGTADPCVLNAGPEHHISLPPKFNDFKIETFLNW